MNRGGFRWQLVGTGSLQIRESVQGEKKLRERDETRLSQSLHVFFSLAANSEDRFACCSLKGWKSGEIRIGSVAVSHTNHVLCMAARLSTVRDPSGGSRRASSPVWGPTEGGGSASLTTK